MKKHTICDAALDALKKNGSPMSAEEIFNFIIKHDLYQFKAKNPRAILKSEMRKHCFGIDLSDKGNIKYFKLQKEGLFWINEADQISDQ